MNKLIVSAVVILGVFLSVGSWGCHGKTENQTKPESQEKKEYDPRLILPEGEIWKRESLEHLDNNAFYVFMEYGEAIKVILGRTSLEEGPDMISNHTWYTRNDTMFIGDHIAKKYSIAETHLIFPPEEGSAIISPEVYQKVEQKRISAFINNNNRD